MAANVDLQEALRKAHAPVTVTFGERWHLNLVTDALEAEEKKLTGRIARSKHRTTKESLTRRLEGVLAALEAANAALRMEA